MCTTFCEAKVNAGRFFGQFIDHPCGIAHSDGCCAKIAHLRYNKGKIFHDISVTETHAEIN